MNASVPRTEVWTTDQGNFRAAVAQMIHTYFPDAGFQMSAFERLWGPKSDAALALVDGMMTMISNHFRSDDAKQRFKPFELCVLLSGSNASPEAWVAPVPDFDGGYVIALSPGLMTSLADPFMRHMTYPEFLEDVGDVASCSAQGRDLPLDNLPADPERQQAAVGFAMLGLLVVLYHEMAHILRGHSAYYASQSGFAHLALSEFVALRHSGISDEESLLLRRALELDADMTAGRFLGSVTQQLNLLRQLVPQGVDVSWAVGYVAATVFYSQSQYAVRQSFRGGYHLPASRVEGFLSGFGHDYQGRNEELMREGVATAFALIEQMDGCLEPLDNIDSDIADIEASTWPYLLSLRDSLNSRLPLQWHADPCG